MPTRASSHSWTRAIVLRTLGMVTLIAFVSAWVQIHGLVGTTGILPFDDHFDRIATTSAAPLSDAPSLLWLWPTDAGLHALCLAGCVLSCLLIAPLPLEGPVLLGLWALYLSLCHAGQVFFGYQWDTLLTETLFTAMLIARWKPGTSGEPPLIGIWALRLLLFKLMLGSGAVKLTSGDPTWMGGTALSVHYFTQPIPNPLSWFFHHLPAGWHSLETWATLFIELVLPFAIFARRPGRIVAFVGFTLVLGLLFATGNYGFFQLLSMVLVLSLLDDDILRALPWGRIRGQRIAEALHSEASRASPRIRGVQEGLAGIVLAGLLLVGIPNQIGRTWRYDDLSPWALDLVKTAYPWRTANAYGLFARMTTDRPELRIEGSDDGRTWTPYVFRYKPGPEDRMPPVVAPHMPRLDWQLWFAALSNCRRAAWVQLLMMKLADNEPAVTGLIATDPFPDGGPRFIRAQLELYRFSGEDDAPGWETGGAWWQTSTAEQPYCRPIELR